MSIGIDYGNGITNIDHATGIRYGVIPMHDVTQAWADSSEPEYGEPCCPKCGNEAKQSDDVPDFDEQDDIEIDGCADYYCEHCRYAFDSQDAFGEEPFAFNLDDGEYLCTQSADDCDIFVLKSPYFTYAQFCSPCAPGACYLRNYSPDGPKCYCLGPDWFDDSACPYPVYSVETGKLVFEPLAETEE